MILTKDILQDTVKSKSKYKEKFNDSSMITYRMKVPYNYFKASEQDSITVVQKMSKQQRRHYVTRITLS